jgi:UDP-glucuronate 4-epimerase
VIGERRILVTGGGGFIGSWAASALLNAGWAVGIFDQREARELRNRILGPGCHDPIIFIQGDIRNQESVHAAVQSFRPNALLHLAAALIPRCQSDPSFGAAVNVVGLVNVFEAARKASVERIVYTSSAAAYIRGDGGALTSLYGAYKLAGEEIARVYWASNRIPSIGLRPSVVYGYGRGMTHAGGGGMTAALNDAIIAAIRGESYQIPLMGKYRFESIEEVSDVIVRCASAHLEGALVSDITTNEISVADFVLLLRQLFPNSKINATHTPTVRRYEAPNNTHLRELIGDWRHVDLVTGIAHLAERLQGEPSGTEV